MDPRERSDNDRPIHRARSSRRLVFAYGWKDDLMGVPPESTTVEIKLEEADGKTTLSFAHRSIPPDVVDDHWRNRRSGGDTAHRARRAEPSEVGVVTDEDGTGVIHAMKAREKFLEGWWIK